MPSPDEPTPWEIVRRITGLEDDLKDQERRSTEGYRNLAQQLHDAKESADRKFVRKDVWTEARKADGAVTADLASDVLDLKADRKSDVAFRRQVQLGLAIAAISSMTAIAIAVFTLLARSS